jgi:RNA-directed DNA polymerase
MMREGERKQTVVEVPKLVRRRRNRGNAETPGQVRGMTWSCPSGVRHVDGASPHQAFVRNVRTCRSDAKGEVSNGQHHEGERTDAEHRDGAARSSEEGSVMGLERRGRVVQPSHRANRLREERDDKAKPFDIPKRQVWEAFKKVKANRGAAGMDGQTIEAFEADLASSLYKLWNRMSSGSYHPRRWGRFAVWGYFK